MKPLISPKSIAAARGSLRRANLRFLRDYPGEPLRRQPVHIYHEGAQHFSAARTAEVGRIAQETLRRHAPDATALGHSLGLPAGGELAARVHRRVVEKLEREPIEDFRIDFEDGFGARPDDEEDRYAVSVGEEVAKGLAEGTLPPFVGIRLKPFSEELFSRSARTLDLFVGALARASGGKVPENFVVCLTKVNVPEHVSMLAKLLGALETRARIRKGALKIELMIETAQAFFDTEGAPRLRALAAAGGGRVISVNFGTYDFTASLNITAAYQSMAHPACDFARHLMQVAFAGTGITISDGATNVMPLPPHAGEGDLTPEQRRENDSVVHRAWQVSYKHIRHGLERAYYQGSDLHPTQLPIRYAAVYAFFLEGLAPASLRMRTFLEKAAQATVLGGLFDDAATGQGLLNYFLRGVSCGALTAADVAASGLTPEDLEGRSFAAILKRRTGQS